MTRTLAALLLFAGTAAFAADPPATADTKALDKSIVGILRDIHDRGADLYNQSKDYPAAYRLYEGSLLTVKPLLAHRPDVQKAIDDGLVKAGKDPDPAGKAFALHEAIEKVRAELKGGPPKSADPKPIDPMPKPIDPKKPAQVSKTYTVADGMAVAVAKSLYEKFPSTTITTKVALNRIVVVGTADEQIAIAKWLEEKTAPAAQPKEPAPMPRPKETKKDAAAIMGKVTVQGKPLAEGTVTFVPSDPKAKGIAATVKDGSYTVKDVPVGKYVVAVTSDTEGAVPAKFGNPKTSGLTFQVQAGANQFDIELK